MKQLDSRLQRLERSLSVRQQQLKSRPGLAAASYPLNMFYAEQKEYSLLQYQLNKLRFVLEQQQALLQELSLCKKQWGVAESEGKSVSVREQSRSLFVKDNSNSLIRQDKTSSRIEKLELQLGEISQRIDCMRRECSKEKIVRSKTTRKKTVRLNARKCRGNKQSKVQEKAKSGRRLRC